jgi:hypothetical protein
MTNSKLKKSPFLWISSPDGDEASGFDEKMWVELAYRNPSCLSDFCWGFSRFILIKTILGFSY